MAWSTITNADIDVDTVVRANTLAAFRDNQFETRRFAFAWCFAETAVTETAFTAKQSLPVTFPNVEGTTGVTRQIVARIQAKVASGGQTLTLRLRDAANGTSSSEVPVTGTTFAWYSMTLAVAEPLRGTDMTIAIEGKVASGGQTGTVYCAPSVASELRY
jgi:hypothetical protein